MSPAKNVELTEWSSERWTENSDFIWPSVCGYNIQRKVDHICHLNIFLMYNFEHLWVMSSYVRPNLIALLMRYKKSILYTYTHSWDKGLSGNLQYDHSRV